MVLQLLRNAYITSITKKKIHTQLRPQTQVGNTTGVRKYKAVLYVTWGPPAPASLNRPVSTVSYLPWRTSSCPVQNNPPSLPAPTPLDETDWAADTKHPTNGGQKDAVRTSQCRWSYTEADACRHRRILERAGGPAHRASPSLPWLVLQPFWSVSWTTILPQRPLFLATTVRLVACFHSNGTSANAGCVI